MAPKLTEKEMIDQDCERLGMTRDEAKFFSNYHPFNFFCRLADVGRLSEEEARCLAKERYEPMYKEVMMAMGKKYS